MLGEIWVEMIAARLGIDVREVHEKVAERMAAAKARQNAAETGGGTLTGDPTLDTQYLHSGVHGAPAAPFGVVGPAGAAGAFLRGSRTVHDLALPDGATVVCTLSGSQLSGWQGTNRRMSEVKMIDPASLADWAQASLVAALLGGLGAACGWALREDQRERLVTARSTTQVATAPVSTGPALERG